ncbi:hypothetical protein BURPS305_2631 [Burkholderia pseudomallei 305]|nr:hypothetical protein BURPS305_2631 [Burkholderia pseudomallei 305]
MGRALSSGTRFYHAGARRPARARRPTPDARRPTPDARRPTPDARRPTPDARPRVAPGWFAARRARG